ncbi:MAG: F0F1 ATP synthase subunit delta [Chloroflexi bacterium]|nr:F0F1 ATP synthase subunit delta [Chloroflexota bacterium]
MARSGTAARRYAEAAFELAGRDDAYDTWAEGLALMAGVAADSTASRAIDNPATPHGVREAAVATLFEGRVASGTLNLGRLLARRGRFEDLPAVAAEFSRLLNRRNGVVEAVVTSAAPLTATEADAVGARIRTMTGSVVSLRSEVDPRLIGGITIKVGDELHDASVRGRLERLREQLVADSR